MSQPKTVLLLNGSPKCEKSNSRQIGKFLSAKLEEKGLKPEEAFIARLIKSPQGTEKLSKLVDQADIVVFTTPLYVDSIPSFTIKAMEMIRDHRVVEPQVEKPLLVAVMNCGFPEKEHMEIALKIIKNFAEEASLRWGGAVSVAMGEALNGEPLSESGGMTRNLTKGLSLAAASLAEGQPIPLEAEELTSKSFLPLFLAKSMLRVFGKRMWNNQAKGNGDKPDMYARPYESGR
ncbi:MAG TPA: NAD(P)H-dependent oxidoreductase [Candidatus Limnocylindrales bacterium]|nr:NAD(P)H-dependent oxidoreductase [Candidatus Limnocylindrales bacterium]